MSAFILYQREVDSGNYVPARSVRDITRSVDREKDALTNIRPGYHAWIVKFKQRPPSKLWFTACEEAIREGRDNIQLPTVTKKEPTKPGVFLRRLKRA